MRNRTAKRAKQEVEYRAKLKEFDERAKVNGTYFCFFCGWQFGKTEQPSHHHLFGRENDLLLDDCFWVLAHAQCHREYHDLPVAKQTWRQTFLNNLKAKEGCERRYEIELEKANK